MNVIYNPNDILRVPKYIWEFRTIIRIWGIRKNILGCCMILSVSVFTLVGCVNSLSARTALESQETIKGKKTQMSSTAANFAFRHEPGTAIECLSVGPRILLHIRLINYRRKTVNKLRTVEGWGTQTCIHQNIVQRSKFEKTDLPTSELGTTCQIGIMYIMPFLKMK